MRDRGSAEAAIGFAAVRSPFKTHRLCVEFAGGLSVAEMMAAVGMMPDTPARVFLGGRPVADAERATTFPRAGEIVTVRAIPAGHGKNPLEIVLEVVVAAAAAALGQYYLAPALAEWGFGSITAAGSVSLSTTGAAIQAAVVTGISTLGKLEVQSLFPSSGKTSLPKIQSTPASYSISGNENITAPFSVIPRVYGQRRIYPMLAAPSFNESGGNSHNELYTNEYLRMLFVLGYGPLDITQIKIGDTLLSDYEDVEWEVRAGYPDDAPPSLYTGAGGDPRPLLPPSLALRALVSTRPLARRRQRRVFPTHEGPPQPRDRSRVTGALLCNSVADEIPARLRARSASTE